jgi:hypothetical protein
MQNCLFCNSLLPDEYFERDDPARCPTCGIFVWITEKSQEKIDGITSFAASLIRPEKIEYLRTAFSPIPDGRMVVFAWNTEELISTAIVARIFNVSVGRISKQINAGKYPHAQRVDPAKLQESSHGTWRIPRSDITEHLYAPRRRPNADNADKPSEIPLSSLMMRESIC